MRSPWKAWKTIQDYFSGLFLANKTSTAEIWLRYDRERKRENAPPWTASVPLVIGFDFSTGREPLLQEGVVVVAAMACDSSVESMTKVLVAAAPPSAACADDPNCCWASRTTADCGKVEIAASKDGRSVAEAATTCATPMLLQLRRALILNWRTMLGGSRGMRGGRKKPFDDKSKPNDLFPPPPKPPEDGGALVLVEDAPEASGLQSWHPPTPNPTPGSIDVAAAPACSIQTVAIAEKICCFLLCFLFLLANFRRFSN